jgi:hypothetical protein
VAWVARLAQRAFRDAGRRRASMSGPLTAVMIGVTGFGMLPIVFINS